MTFVRTHLMRFLRVAYFLAAVFALSQRPDDEAVPILMDVARTAADAETRRTAMFWLAQSEDDRVLSFFESILTGRRGG